MVQSVSPLEKRLERRSNLLTFGPVAVFGGDRVTVVITDVRLAGKVCVKRRAPCRLDVFCLRREGLVFRPAKLLSIHNLGVRAVCRPRASPRRRCRCRGTFVRDPCPSPGSCRPSFLSADFAPFLGSTSTALESRAAFAVCHDDCFGLCAMLQNEHAVSDTNDSVQNTCKPKCWRMWCCVSLVSLVNICSNAPEQ